MAKERIETQIQGKIIDSDEFYRKATQWADMIKSKSLSNAKSFTKGKEKKLVHGKWKGDKKKTWKKHKSIYYPDGSIENKIITNFSYKIYEKHGITDSLGFKFPRHGVFRTYGVGNGQSINGKQAKRVYVKRTMRDWLDWPIETNIDQLADIASEFYGDKVLVNTYKEMRIKK